jgi:hypothetical protein
LAVQTAAKMGEKMVDWSVSHWAVSKAVLRAEKTAALMAEQSADSKAAR